MNWFEMPEVTERQRAEKEIAECSYCISGVVKMMKQMKIPQKDWSKNVMVEAYLNRIERAKGMLCNL